MNPTLEQRKQQLVERLAEEIRSRVEAGMADSASSFVRHYFYHVAPDDIVYSSPETLLGSTLSLWEHAQRRTPGTASVRIFNPAMATHGWSTQHTVIETLNDDMPFLVDSLTAELNQVQRNIHQLIHPVIPVRRDAEGKLLEVLPPGVRAEDHEDVSAESVMHIEIDEETQGHDLEALVRRLDSILEDVRAAVADWRAMRQKLHDAVTALEEGKTTVDPEALAEEIEFLRWVEDDHFVFLGYRRYDFAVEDGQDFLKVDPSTGLGILREVRAESLQRSESPMTAEYSAFARRPEAVIVAKANNRATVHRPVHMDRIGVKRFAPDGRIIGEDRFLGLFTSAAYSRSVRRIPLLRRKVARTIERTGLAPDSHDGKALLQILETLPRDEVFQMSEDELFEISRGILQLQERTRIALFVRKDVFERFVSCLVYIPRDRYNSEIRERVRVILEEAFAGTVTVFNTQMSESPLARAHFIVKTTPGRIPSYDVRRLEALVTEASRTWGDHLRDVLTLHEGEEEGLQLYRRYRDIFPAGYQERFPPEAAMEDIPRLERTSVTGEIDIRLYKSEDDRPHEAHCRIMTTGAAVHLSDLMPRIENMGVKVESEIPFEITLPSSEQPVHVRDFSLVGVPEEVECEDVRGKFEDAFRRAWNGEVENDGFNRLVLHAGLSWDEVVVIRAYCKFLRQVGISFSEAYMQQTLGAHGEIAQLLIRLFRLMFDPALTDDERAETEIVLQTIEHELEHVTNADDDRILRAYLNAIESTLRTNWFRRNEDGSCKPYLSLKFDSRAVLEMPPPRPMFEIFVYSPRFEAVHLRGGKVARGGLRWSDRREDFRTEVLGLVKAQIVKNAVIVPVGSKGGFVLKQPPAAREEFQQEGIACYRNFLRGLLDVTDNLQGRDVIPPSDVVRRDGDDPYLVVAADKGTATFSDIANGISEEYGFWLGDAFASGGSAGYDHKKMGITARGAWEAVKRHFREMGKNIQEEDFTVVGVGDMSGDVFGNGMLLSRHIRLVGAFNHLHVFVDPDPDPEISFQERERMFNLPRSSWSDYDTSKLSPGGAVFDRKTKSITISEQVRERFGLTSLTLSPNELIRAILRSRAELLWLGGIGTYVKASDESHADARDRANDALRIDATELRVSVVGEGANLGMTQRARIEFALEEGGRLNTDAIDNSAGVDTSDHEVNIKILLDEAVRGGDLSSDERLELLVEMTDQVGELVLRDNYQQTQAISVAEAQGSVLADQQMRLMRSLEKLGRLDRGLEYLPDDDQIAERIARGQAALTRPELSVLLAYGKIFVYEELLESDLPDDPLLVEDLILYFPDALRQRFRTRILEHRLRREIIATFVTNSMVNRVGATFVTTLMEETGRPVSDIARAYTITRDSFELRHLWAEIESLDNVIPASEQIGMLIEIGRLVERTTRWFLANGAESLDITAAVAAFRPRVQKLIEVFDDILPAGVGSAIQVRAEERRALGIPEPLALRIASLEVWGSFPDIVRIARDTTIEVEDVGRIYFGVGSRFDLEHMRAAAALIQPTTVWHRAAVAGLIDDLYDFQGRITLHILGAAADGELDVAIDSWLARRPRQLSQIDELVADLRSSPTVDLSMLTVLSRQLRALLES